MAADEVVSGTFEAGSDDAGSGARGEAAKASS